MYHRHMRVLRLAVLLATVLCLAGAALPAHPTAAAASLQVFTEPGSGVSPVTSLIRTARHSLRLEVYLLTDRAVINALAQAHRRGVDVRVMLEERPYGAGRYAQSGYRSLQAAGVTVRWANEAAFTYTHEKAMVIDDRVAGIFTFNLSVSGLERNREFGVIDNRSADAHTLAAIFDADWVRRSAKIGSTRLVVSPQNARRDFDTLIDGARHTLDLYAEEVDDSGVESRLIAARRRHVRVRLITSADSAGVENLRRAGIAVTIMTSPYVHAKAMVADGSRVFIGSENVSTTSLDHNRELGIMLADSGVAAVVEHTFAADWASSGRSSSPPPPPSSSPPPSGSGLPVRVTATPGSVTRGQDLTITTSTAPGASCAIQVTYPDGYVSRAASLQGSRTASSAGTVSWSWHVGSTVTGTAHAAVTCTLGSRTASGSTAFEIR